MLKSWDINLRQSEKKTLVSFFILYAFFTIVLLLFFAIYYYNTQKDLMLQSKRLGLSTLASEQIERLKEVHVNFDKTKRYPRDTRFKSAIYDSTYHKIFSLLDHDADVDLNQDIYMRGNKIFFIKEPEYYYLGAKYVVIEVKDSGIWKQTVYKNLVIYGGVFLFMMLAMGYFLMHLILKPMKEAISLLDRFIKDTTHELNTPVGTILSNIELSENTHLDEKLKKRLARIKIAARTISNLHQDLIFLTLENKIISKNESIDMKALILERLEYVSLFLKSKKIQTKTRLQEQVFLEADRNKIVKLIDNLISNAIKYNKINGSLEVILSAHHLSIKNSGRGIAKEKLSQIFNRYERADKSVGGFGIGLSIVSKIAEEYHLKITIDSKVNEYTEVQLSW
ncbi:sensor histidine kinase [Sulfurospirillum sp. 1612]|uniref:sensor histidine kinase n=1 Tax=Sulfurospirillum sp. 1612 TaxID=3094835 RepID=UPI002F934015